MTTKKKAPPGKTASQKKDARKLGRPAKVPVVPPRPQYSEEYEKVLKEYGAALELLHGEQCQEAMERFKAIEAGHPDEPALAQRARTYIRICARKLATPGATPRTADERYHQAVFLANDGRLDEAMGLLDQALREEPDSPRLLYARASVRALQGNAEAAVADLRQAIAVEPRIVYQAVNDPDFEKIRDEASFIDLIEPTPAGT